ncbi:hypothetical protein ACU8KI_08830 [Rhizobium leguminosarum]
MWIALTTVTGTNMVLNVNRIGGVWEQKDGSSRLLVDGEEVFAKEQYSKIMGAIRTSQPVLG